MNINRFRKTAALSAAVAAAVTAIAIPAGSAYGQRALEEIVVTAQRREEALLDTPLTVTAIGNELLETQNVRDLQDISVLVPGMTIEPDGSRTSIRIRGLATSDGTPAAENIAALHVDDIYISHRTTLEGYFYDIAQVEVLQGPQGTLYGRNTAAGTINIRTARPVLGERMGSVELQYGNYRTRRANGMLNIPLTDTLALRAAFQTMGRDGYLASNVDRQPQDMYGRISLQWEPSDRLSVFAKYEFGSNEDRANTQVIVGTVDNSTDPNNWALTKLDDDSWFDDTQLAHPNDAASIAIDSARRAYSQSDFESVMTEITYDLTDNTSFIAALARIEEKYTSFGGDPVEDGAVGFGIVGGVNGSFTTGTPWIEQTADLRLQGLWADQLNWTVGLFYWEDDTNEPAFNPTNLAFNAAASLAEAKSVYGQVAWTPPSLDRLTVTLGGRYTEDWKAWDFEVNFPFGTVGGSGGYLEQEWTNEDYKVGLAWSLTDNSQIYFNTSTGYRAGSWFPGPLPSYNPEYVDAWELGWKGRLLNDTLELSANTYFYDYTDMAIQFDSINTLAPPGRQSEIGYYNLGDAEIQGFNLNGVWLATDADRFDFNVDITNAEIKTFDFASAQAAFPAHYLVDPTAVFNWEGLDVPNTIPVRLTVGWAREFNLADGIVDSRVQGVWNDSRFYNYRSDGQSQYEFPGYEIDSYATFDWNLRYTPAAEDWFVALYIRNILDERALTQVGGGTDVPDPNLPIGQQPVLNGGDSYLTGRPIAPRTFGVRFGLNF
tara:strand:- start:115486 stop:117801 length:2316 start_codon:yes stop_codon:yes gene_type:complete